MPRNGAGSYNLVAGNPVVTNTTISSTWANSTLSDIASALTQSVAKDGQTIMTNNLPMGGFKLTNLGAGTNAGDSVRYQQLFSQGVPLDIASAATTDIGGQNTAFLNVTGSVGITSFGTNYNGPRILTFTDSLTLTHNATTLVLPNSTNITTKSGDYAIFAPKSTVSGNADGWALVSYINSDGNVYVKDQAYDDSEWNGNLSVPTKNAVRDKIETIVKNIVDSGTAVKINRQNSTDEGGQLEFARAIDNAPGFYLDIAGGDTLPVFRTVAKNYANSGAESVVQQLDSFGNLSSSILGASGLYPEFKCRGFCNFSGVGSISIRSTGNVLGIARIGLGDYEVTLANSMPDQAFACPGSAIRTDTPQATTSCNAYPIANNKIKIFTNRFAGGVNERVDCDVVSLSIFR